jgi:hypothetical protein
MSVDGHPSPPPSPPHVGQTVSPTSPQSSEMDVELHYLLNAEPFPTKFWDDVLNARLKRGISGSGAVDLTQKDTRFRIF